MPWNWKRAALAAALIILPWAASVQGTEPEREESSGFLFRFRAPWAPTVVGGSPHEGGDDHHGLSADEFAQRQADVKAFWEQHKASGAPLDQKVVIELFRRAKHFSVVHALLADTISAGDSVRIGELRAAIHQQVLTNLYETGRYGSRLGVNDFGTVGNAKSDIDFVPFADDHLGADMVAAYEAEFRRVTSGVAPGQMDIVAHEHEAYFPDWRQSCAVADFVQKLRHGRGLLRANPEAYFLEGSYNQQIMGRSADGTTLTWIERDANGKIVRTPSNAAADPNFFYFRPDVRARYAWGGAVGNWHFYHSHSNDKVAQAKYLLRSMDDGARLSRLSADQVKSFAKFEKLSPAQQAQTVRSLYGDRVPADVVQRFLAVMQTAAKIRELKAAGAATDGADAYRSMIELERRANPQLSDDGLLERAKRSMDTHGAAMLLENNILAAEARLKDWVAPPVDSGEFRTVDSSGKVRRIVIDQEKVRRLQMSAFFELRDGIELLPDSEVRRIQQENPRFADDIRILKGVIETQRQMALAPDHLSAADARAHRIGAAERALQELSRLNAVIDEGGPLRFYDQLGRSAWHHAQQFEDWMQQRLVNAMARTLTGGDARLIPLLDQMRQATQDTNERFLGPRWMARLDKANAVIEVLKAYAREGEVNAEVAKVAFYQGLSYVPGVGTLMQVQGGLQGVITLASTQVIPGYGQMLIVLQLAKNTVELAGLAVFEPLKDDRELLAYQGYLDAGGSGLITTGQSERFEGRVTPVVQPMDPGGNLSLEARRARIYHYFHDDIAATLARDPSFPFTEEEWPQEWMAKELEWLTVRIRQHVLHWWNATGPFESNDEILAFRGRLAGMSEEEFRARIESRLWRDYWRGRERAMQEKIVEGESEYQDLETKMAQVAAVQFGLDRHGRTLSRDYENNGQMVFAEMLDGMPVMEPAVEILTAPEVDKLELDEDYEAEEVQAVPMVNLSARVYASTQDHPLPWSIAWEVLQEGGSRRFDWANTTSAGTLEKTVGEAPGPWPVTVTAVARDAENREIARQSIDLAVEKVELGRTPEEQTAEDDEEQGADDDAAVAEADPDADNDPDAQEGSGQGEPDPLDGVAPAATAAAETATEACAGAADHTAVAKSALDGVSSELDGLEGDLASARAALDRLDMLVQQARAAAAQADNLAEALAVMRDQTAHLRDALCSPDFHGDAAETSAGLRWILTQAETMMDVIRNASAATREARAEAASIIATDDLRARLEGAAEQIEASAAALEGAVAAADQAVAAAAQAELQRTRAAEAIAAEAGARAQAVFEQAREAATSAAECAADARTAIDETAAGLDAARARVGAVAAGLDEMEALSSEGALAEIDAAVAEAEATEAVAEAFLDSIANRVEGGMECVWNRPTRSDPTEEREEGDGGWTRSGDSGWSAGEVETVERQPATPPEPVDDPRIDGMARTAGDAFNDCDYATARRLADQIAAIDPEHPWLIENYRKILEADRMRRAALRALQEAEAAMTRSQGGVQDLVRARDAAHRAAMVAPPCLVDRIDGLVDQVDTAIADAAIAERDRRRRERAESGQGIASAIGAVIGTIAAVGAASEGIDIPPIPGVPVRVPTGGSSPRGGSTEGGSTGGSPGGGAVGGATGGGAEEMCTPERPCCDVSNYFSDVPHDEDEPYTYWVWELGNPSVSSYTAIPLPADKQAEIRNQMASQMRAHVTPGFKFLWHGPYGSMQAAIGQTRRLCPNPVELPPSVREMIPSSLINFR